MDWTKIFTPNPHVMILGNPPFTGARVMNQEQKSDTIEVWGKSGTQLDYVTAWYKKASDFYQRVPRGGRFAFVSTNSIAQGQPVAALFRPLFDAGWRIRFAHQTFAWTSEAPGAAAVHCVIIGFDKKERAPALLFTYEHPKAEPVAQPASNINAYLIDSPHLFVGSLSKPLVSGLPIVRYGSMPNDGGYLLVEPSEIGEVKQDAVAVKYLRRFIGARELIRSTDRWCLWLEDLDPADVGVSAILRERLAGVQTYREASQRAATKKLAQTPALFGEIRQPKTPYVCIPAHFSETRRYATVAFLEPDVIAGNANFTAEDPTGYLFAIISSSMFLAWQKAVGGRLESRLRFSATVVWNNLPLPNASEGLREQIIEAGQGVLQARALHPYRSLADHYNPLAMDPALIRAHDALDHLVDRALGAKHTLTTDAERQELLFKQYVKLVKDTPTR